jgi:hypothetical protein
MRPLLKGRNADEETGPSVGRGSVIRTRDPLLPKKGSFSKNQAEFRQLLVRSRHGASMG